jgi:hypothetical protein
VASPLLSLLSNARRPTTAGHKEGTMLEYTGRTEPIEKPSRLQLAILEWQRQLVDKARMAHDEGQSNGNGEAAADLH